ncbi:MAG: hypothetical protein M1812_001142 [Candelaria pacifica]|nr:MAG: hypothetical protein M1812_001142 [Candelaria pacifica]
MSTKAAEQKSFIDAVKSRRTYYQLTNESTIPDSRIEELVRDAILHCPSSFNSQSTRLVVLLKKEHEQLWDMVKDVLQVITSEEKFKSTQQRISGFRGGYGTLLKILFFEDPAPIKELQTKFATYAEHFPQWSEHTSAIHQYMLWTALEAEGLGCNLQHYNPIIDQKVQDHWKIPTEWSLKAQLVFGKPAAQPSEKSFKPVEERVFIHGN